jgi:hypothetical protein
VVSAVNAAGESANSGQVSATPASGVTGVPAAPTGLTATAGDTQVSLSWSASSSATGYHVKRATTSGGPYTQVATPTSTNYTDTGLTDGTTYYYVVSAVNAAGESANSGQVSATPASSPTTGTWTNVTPSVDLINGSCGNYGTQTVQADTANPGALYAQFNCQGIWKSTDYGLTWSGPINSTASGGAVSDCAGGITVSPVGAGVAPIIYEACIRGNMNGLWKSTDGGVNWTHYAIGTLTRQDFYPPVIDPYDANHLLMGGHEHDDMVQSTDAGLTWQSVTLDSGMLQNGGTGLPFFIDTGVASTTRTTWLWIGQQDYNKGTWRTANGGTNWTQVDNNVHPLGAAQVYQPDTSGILFMAGQNSSLGAGVLRSIDFGGTWAHVGQTGNPETAVVGTSKDVYAMYGAPVGPTGSDNPAFEVASQPGTATWTSPSIPSALNQGTAQFAVVNDGTHNILVGAMWNNGVWRYVEP